MKIAILILVYAICSYECCFSADKASPVVVGSYMSLKYNSNDTANVVIDIQITNICRKTIEILPEYLPWGLDSMILHAVCLDKPNGTALQRIYFEAYPVGEMVVIKPGEVKSGHYSLETVFPYLDDARNRADVLLLWSYTMSGHPELVRQYGVLLIPKRQL